MRAFLLSIATVLAATAVTACSSGSSPAAPPPASGGAGGDSGGAGGSAGGQGGFVGSLGGQPSRPSLSPGVPGVYVISPRLTTGGPTITDDIYALPTFDGVVLRLRWDVFEPKPDTYDFFELDAELERARNAGKKVALALLAGPVSPPWIYDTSKAEELVFVVAGGDASGGDCQALHLPAPWDPAYQAALTAAIARLGLHLSQQPAVLDGIRMVAVTGIEASAEDVELPLSSGGTTPLGCQLTDTLAAWKAAGYRPSRVRDAWTGLLAAYAQAFPTMTLLAPTVRAGFPGIDEDGATADPAAVDPTSSLIDIGNAMAPGRFAVQGADLTTDSVDARVAAALAGGALVGFRPNDFLGKDGAGCGSDDPASAVPCTDAAYGEILHHGVDLGARFLTVRVVEVAHYPGSVEDAQTALRAGP